MATGARQQFIIVLDVDSLRWRLSTLAAEQSGVRLELEVENTKALRDSCPSKNNLAVVLSALTTPRTNRGHVSHQMLSKKAGAVARRGVRRVYARKCVQRREAVVGSFFKQQTPKEQFEKLMARLSLKPDASVDERLYLRKHEEEWLVRARELSLSIPGEYGKSCRAEATFMLAMFYYNTICGEAARLSMQAASAHEPCRDECSAGAQQYERALIRMVPRLTDMFQEAAALYEQAGNTRLADAVIATMARMFERVGQDFHADLCRARLRDKGARPLVIY